MVIISKYGAVLLGEFLLVLEVVLPKKILKPLNHKGFEARPLKEKGIRKWRKRMEPTIRFEDAENGCRLIHIKSGHEALIDKTMVVPLKAWIHEHGLVYCNRGLFYTTDLKRRPLIKIIAALAYGMDVEQLDGHTIRAKNGKKDDLRVRNISYKPKWEATKNPDCRVVYDSEFSAVYDLGINIWLLIKDDGLVVKLDARNAIRELMVALIKSGHRVNKLPYQSHVIVTDPFGNRSRLANHVISEMYHVPLTTLQTGIVSYWDGNPLNLTEANVLSTKAPTYRNVNRSIRIQGDCVYIWLNKGLPHYTDCSTVMGPILTMPVWSWHQRTDGRLAATVSKDGQSAKINEVYLYHLRWAAAYYGATADYLSISGALRVMKDDFRANDDVIDHLDGNYRNNNLWNLSRMRRSENTVKGNLVSKIFAPFFWFSVRLDSEYRILYGDDLQNPQYLVCKNVEEYINTLKRFYKEGIGNSARPKDIVKGKRVGYDYNGNLTNEGQRIVRRLLESEEVSQ